MIGILQNEHLNEIKMNDIEKWHWGVVNNLTINKTTLTNNKIVDFFLNMLNVSSLESIVKASPSELSDFVDKLQQCKNVYPKYDWYFKRVKKLFKKFYDKYRSYNGAKLVKKLELSVCPYCNRNFISSTEDLTTAQLDHFYNKDEYPILALSLYNLIPCCETCNHRKGTAQFDISPYDKEYTTDDIIRFKYILQGNGEYEIEVKARNQPNKKSIQTNIDKLHLKDLYSTHTDIVKELILKNRHYCKKYIRTLNKLFKKSKLPNRMTAEEIYYGNYLSQDKYYLRPLSKFTRDIVDDVIQQEK